MSMACLTAASVSTATAFARSLPARRIRRSSPGSAASADLRCLIGRRYSLTASVLEPRIGRWVDGAVVGPVGAVAGRAGAMAGQVARSVVMLVHLGSVGGGSGQALDAAGQTGATQPRTRQRTARRTARVIPREAAALTGRPPGSRGVGHKAVLALTSPSSF